MVVFFIEILFNFGSSSIDHFLLALGINCHENCVLPADFSRSKWPNIYRLWRNVSYRSHPNILTKNIQYHLDTMFNDLGNFYSILTDSWFDKKMPKLPSKLPFGGRMKIGRLWDEIWQPKFAKLIFRKFQAIFCVMLNNLGEFENISIIGRFNRNWQSCHQSCHLTVGWKSADFEVRFGNLNLRNWSCENSKPFSASFSTILVNLKIFQSSVDLIKIVKVDTAARSLLWQTRHPRGN